MRFFVEIIAERLQDTFRLSVMKLPRLLITWQRMPRLFLITSMAR